MTSFTFKSSGVLSTDKTLEKTKEKTPIGIKTPLRLGENEVFAMSTSIADQIHDNLKNLLMTQRGERWGRYSFGTILRSILFDLARDDFDDTAIASIREAISLYMPFVEPLDFQRKIENDNNEHIGKLIIRMTYNVPRLNIKNKGLEVVMYVGG